MLTLLSYKVIKKMKNDDSQKKKQKNIRLDAEKKKSGNGQCFSPLIIFVVSLKYSSSEILFSYHFVLSSLICIKILLFEL
jgi:hypothetical protein